MQLHLLAVTHHFFNRRTKGAPVKFAYDIFRRLPDGGPIWIEAVQTLEGAKLRLTSLLQTQPGDYFVYDLSHNKIVDSVETRA